MNGDDRSVSIGGRADRAVITTGDHNTVSVSHGGSGAAGSARGDLASRLADARRLVEDGAFDEALAVVLDLLSAHRAASPLFADLHNEAIALGGEVRELRRAERRALEPPEHYERRWRRLRGNLLGLIDEVEPAWDRSGLAAPAAQPGLSTEFEAPVEPGLEKIWGRGTLQSLAWLHRGLAAARAVCRVSGPYGLGTGFLLPGGIVMTNNHVVPSEDIAARTSVEFNYQEDARGRIETTTAYEVDPDGFVTSPMEALDCTLLRLKPAADAPPLTHWGALTLADRPAEIGEHVSIIQHPDGGVKKIAVTANEVVNLYGPRVHYMTDTMPGSSGAPVFADDWRVVALHRAGGKLRKNAAGDWIHANEGILISEILRATEFADRLKTS